MGWAKCFPCNDARLTARRQVDHKGQPYYTRRDAAHHRPGCWEVSRDARKSRVGAGVAGKKGGDPWVARRPVPLPLRPCPPWATQASPLHSSPLPLSRVGFWKRKENEVTRRD